MMPEGISIALVLVFSLASFGGIAYAIHHICENKDEWAVWKVLSSKDE